MDVRGAHVVSLQQHHGGELDDGSLTGVAFGRAGAHVHFVVADEDFAHRFFHPLHGVLRGAVEFYESGAEGVGRGADKLHLALEHGLDGVEGVEIERIIHRDDDAAEVVHADGDDAVTPCDVGRDDVRDFIGNAHMFEVDEVHRRIRGHGAIDIFLREKTFADEHIHCGLAALSAIESVFDLAGGNEGVFLEDF